LFVLPGDGLGNPRLKDMDRLVQMAAPELDGPAAGYHTSGEFRMPGKLATRDPAEHELRTVGGRGRRHEISDAKRGGEPDNRGGQPARDLLISAETL
jgi:hypothetical protein